LELRAATTRRSPAYGGLDDAERVTDGVERTAVLSFGQQRQGCSASASGGLRGAAAADGAFGLDSSGGRGRRLRPDSGDRRLHLDGAEWTGGRLRRGHTGCRRSARLGDSGRWRSALVAQGDWRRAWRRPARGMARLSRAGRRLPARGRDKVVECGDG
jgi:hypothetical protein